MWSGGFSTGSKDSMTGRRTWTKKIDKVDQRIAKQQNAIDDWVANLDEKIDKVDQRIAKQQNAIDDRVANLDEKIDKVDQRITKQENAIEGRGQT